MCNGLVKYGVQMVAITTYQYVLLSLGLTPSFPLSLSSLFFLLCLHLLLAPLPPDPPLLSSPDPQPAFSQHPTLALSPPPTPAPLQNYKGSALSLTSKVRSTTWSPVLPCLPPPWSPEQSHPNPPWAAPPLYFPHTHWWPPPHLHSHQPPAWGALGGSLLLSTNTVPPALQDLIKFNFLSQQICFHQLLCGRSFWKGSPPGRVTLKMRLKLK